jgi:hypothetical protein
LNGAKKVIAPFKFYRRKDRKGLHQGPKVKVDSALDKGMTGR